MPKSSSPSYVCDTLPPPRLSNTDEEHMDLQVHEHEPTLPDPLPEVPEPARSPRKLCVRHQRMADSGTNLKLQSSLDALPLEEREQVNTIWQAFSSSPHPRRALILQGLLTMCCFSQLSLLTELLTHLIRIDPFVVLPRELNLKILIYLDATSLCRAAQVSRRWRDLADDDILWRGICEQHIGQKCNKCGWGLPVLEKKRVFAPPMSCEPAPLKRPLDLPSADLLAPPLKRQRSDTPNNICSLIPPFSSLLTTTSTPSDTPPRSVTRPWKDVYSERMTIERNWRRGRCSIKTLKGHTDGVMCLQFSETLQHPAFPVLITGSYDRTVRVWNMETGVELHCLKGHTRAVRTLQFDDVKLITGSMDSTLKVWDWRGGKCIRTLAGHAEGVLCLNYDSSVLASGSVDATIKIWNLRTGGAFTLRGHTDWVNSVQVWDSNASTNTTSGGQLSAVGLDPQSVNGCSLRIDPGKMLFSASDDCTIRLWDLTQRSCVRQFAGHVGQVQSMRLVWDEQCGGDESKEKDDIAAAVSRLEDTSLARQGTPLTPADEPEMDGHQEDQQKQRKKKPMLISGSLDNTIKMWDIDTGKTVRTFFGHIEGVWAIASDKLRLVSGSHDRTIKVWSREEGKCTTTLVGHQAAVSCLALGEDKIVSGSDDNDIKIWSFSE